MACDSLCAHVRSNKYLCKTVPNTVLKGCDGGCPRKELSLKWGSLKMSEPAKNPLVPLKTYQKELRNKVAPRCLPHQIPRNLGLAPMRRPQFAPAEALMMKAGGTWLCQPCAAYSVWRPMVQALHKIAAPTSGEQRTSPNWAGGPSKSLRWVVCVCVGKCNLVNFLTVVINPLSKSAGNPSRCCCFSRYKQDNRHLCSLPTRC